MYISRIFIRNYRNFQLLDVAIGKGVTCFLGENNCGKSNLFQALRLVLDGNVSSARRRLSKEDLSDQLTFAEPNHVMVSVEFSEFQAEPTEEALVLKAVMQNGHARLTYRFRPKFVVRDELLQVPAGQAIRKLTLDDYEWEMIGGGDDVNLAALNWNDTFGCKFSTDTLQQGYVVGLMEALRDVEASLALSRSSPLQRIIEQRNIPEADQNQLVGYLRTANDNINQNPVVGDLGQDISASFRQAAGKSYAMKVRLGLSEPSFNDISKGLKVLLSGYGLTDIDPSRNGLGLNNVLYISMLLNAFEQRMAAKKIAGQLLLVEEPEAHLHPQLQRVFLAMLLRRNIQTFVSSHSTHITSGIGIDRQIVLTPCNLPFSETVRLANIAALTERDLADLDRYLDATRSVLLFARKVLLVEGPAEQFLIPELARHVLNVDLDEEGIAVIPIYGTHFGVYARLFAADGLNKKCAVLADGDLKPSDLSGEEDDEEPTVWEIDLPDSPNVRAFRSATTLEMELTLPGTLAMLSKAMAELGKVNLAGTLETIGIQYDLGLEPGLDNLPDRVLNAAKRIGKARFAQVVSKFANLATEVPAYIEESIKWLVEDAING